MTSKTKYIVIVLFTLILASVSVGLSTWNVHYQAEIGTIGYEKLDPVTQESLLNRYVYFEPVKDTDGNITNPTRKDYPISGSLNENIFTYVYDGNAHTPNVFTPTESTVKGSTDYPVSLFMNDEPLDVNWGIAQSGGVFDDVIFNRQYRLIAMPYVSEHKGQSDNYCEITSIAYGEDTIDITLNWKNGNNGNHQAEGFIVHFVKENGVFVPYLLQNDQYVAYENVQNSKIKQAAFNSVTGALTVQVNGFSPFTVTAANKGWVSAAPSDAGVYQCRITAEYDEESVTDSAAHEAAARTAVSHLNALSDSGTAYAAQVNFAIVAKNTEMADLEHDSFTYQESASTLKAARRTNTTDTKAPLNAGEDVAAESGLHTINDNVNSFYVTYGGVGFEILIESTFTDINGGTVDVQFSTELLTNAKNLKALVENWEEDHYYTTYGVSPDPNYHITNPVVHYTVLRREIKIEAWDEKTFVYNGKAQSPAVSAYTDRYGAEFTYTWANASGTTIAKPTDTNEKSDTASYQVRASVGSNYFIACADDAGTLYDDGETAYVSYDYTITPKPTHLSWGDTTLTYNGTNQLPAVTVLPTDIESGDTVNATIDCTTTPHKDVGTYQTTDATLDNANYVIASGEATAKSFDIVPKPVEITWLQDTLTLTYNGKAQAPTAKVKAGELCGTDQCDVTVDGAEINAGKDYTATATGLSNGNYTLADGTWTTRFNIEPKGVTVVWSTVVLTYNKTAQAPAASVKTGDLCDGDTCDVTVSGAQTNAGTGYTATATGLSNVNYKITAGSTTTFDIEKREVTLNWSATSFEYNGEEQAPTLTLGNLCDGDSVTASVTVDRTHKDVDTYTATATNVSSTNYKLPASPYKHFNITPKAITLDWANLEFTYDKTAHKPTATVNSGDLCGTDTCTVSVSGEQTSAGTGYTATATLSNGNYTATNGTQSFTIKPKEITLSWTNLTFTYDGNEHLPTATAGGLLGGDTCNVTVIVVGEHRAAGTYTAQASALDNTNYTLPTANTKEYTITPKPVEITWADLTLTYDGTAQAPTATVKAGYLCGTDQCEVTVSGAETNAGTYTAKAALDNANYTIANTAQKTFTIEQKGVTVVWSTEPLTYNGNPQAPNAEITSGLITGDDCDVSVSGEKTNAGTGYTATATLTGTHSANYTITSGTTTTFNIEKREVTLNWGATTFVYKGEEQAPTLTLGNLCDGDSVTASVTVDRTHKDVGTYTATAMLTGADCENYQLPDNSTKDFSITQKEITLTWGETEFTYDGTAQSPTASISGYVAGDNVTVTVTVTGEHTNVGAYTATATLSGASNANYKLPTNLTVNFNITKKEITLTWGGTEFTYNGTAQAPTATPNGIIDGDDCDVSVSGAQTNAGTYTATAALDNDNYTATNSTQSFTINPKEITLDWGETEFTYNGNPQAPTAEIASGLLTGDVCSVTVSGAETNAGTYTATATLSNDNYTATNGTGTQSFTITPKLLEKPVNNNTYTYNGTDQKDAIIADFGYGEIITNNYLTIECPNMTNAGTKSIKFTIENENFAWSDGTIGSVNYDISISPAVISVVDPVIGFDYNSAGINIITTSAANVVVVDTINGTQSEIYKNFENDITVTYESGFDLSAYTDKVVGTTYIIKYQITTNNYVWDNAANSSDKIRTFYYKYKTAIINGEYYTIEDAIAEANANATDSSKVRILFAGSNTGDNTHVVTSFSKLTDATNLPNYHDSYTLTNVEFVVPHADSWEGDGNSEWADVTSTIKSSSGYVYAAVIVPQGISLTFNSNSVLAVTASLGYTSNWTKTCNRGVLVNDGTITMKSGSSLHAYGFIKSSLMYDANNNIIVDAEGIPETTGQIIAESDTIVTENMTLFDYPGGNSANKMLNKAFPSNAWAIHNISCTMRINAGSTYRGYVMVLVNDKANSTFATIIGKDKDTTKCLFKPTATDQNSNYVVKRTRPAQLWSENYATYENLYKSLYKITGSNFNKGQRDVFSIYGNYTDDVLTVTVSVNVLIFTQDVTLQTSKSVSAPIGYMDIVIKSGANLELTSSDYMILPGSKLVIEENATVTVDTGIDLMFVDVDTIDAWSVRLGSNKSFGLKDNGNYVYCIDAIDAFAVVNGTLIVKGGIGGEIRTNGNTGILDLTYTTTTLTAAYTVMTGSYGASDDTANKEFYTTGTSEEVNGNVVKDNYGNLIENDNLDKLKYQAYGNVWYTAGEATVTLNNGYGEIIDYVVDKAIMPFTLPTLSRTGYTFKGWQDNSGTSFAAGTTITLFADVTLTAQWTINSYTITVVDGNEQINSAMREYGSTYGDLLPALTKDGYVLSWNIVDTDIYVTSEDIVTYNGNHTIQAVWTQLGDVEITFDTQGGNSIDSQFLVGGDKFTTLPTAKRTGYTFIGWFTEENGNGTQITLNTTIPESDTTYYAHWEPATYTITLDANGGTVDPPTITVTYDSAYGTLPTLTRTGYTFDGWWTAANGGTEITADTVVTITEDQTLYAKWQGYTVTYIANGGSVTPTSSTVVNTAGTVTLATPTLVGYKFTGWYTAASGGSRIGAAGDTYKPSANITLYAQWTINSYTIKVTTSNATVTVNGTTVANGDSITIQYGTQVTVSVSYSRPASRTTTITGADGTTYTSPFNMPAQTVTISSSSSLCVAAGTLITMADGTTKLVEDIVIGDQILAFNHETGKFEAGTVYMNAHDNVEWTTYEIINLEFDDGTKLRIINEHVLFDYTLMQYVPINLETMYQYVGHDMATAKFVDGEFVVGTKKLVKAYLTTEYTGLYNPVVYYYQNCVTDGLLTAAGGTMPMWNIFEYSDNLGYDQEQMQQDIEMYGLYTYEDFSDYMSKEAFDALPYEYLKVAVGKGLLTEEDVIAFVKFTTGALDDNENSITPTDNGASNIPVADTVVDALPPSTASGDKDGLDSD